MRALLPSSLLLLGALVGFVGSRAASDGETPNAAKSFVISSAHASAPPRALDDATRATLEQLPPLGERRYERTPTATSRLARAAKTLEAPGGEIEAPCVSSRGDICVTRALDDFFHAIDGLDRKDRTAPVVVTAWGNSLIAADGIVGVVRERLQDRFGDGGRGLLLAERIAEEALRARTGRGEGWETWNLGQGAKGRHPLGIAGAHHVSTQRGARSAFRVRGETRATVLWLGHERSPGFSVRADGVQIAKQGEGAATGPQSLVVDIPAGTKRLELVAAGRGLVVQGVALERDAGVQLDMLGLPAADSVRWLRADAEVVNAQMKARDPSLVMLMLGGVENRRIAWGKYSEEQVERSMRELVARARTSAPDASCLVVGPVDAVRGVLDEKRLGRPLAPFRERPALRAVNKMYRRVALEGGCGYFDLFSAMGGSGTLKRMNRYGWLLDDHVHPRGFGLDAAGELIADALLRAWQATPRGLDRNTRRALAAVTTPIAPDAAADELLALAQGDERRAVLSLAGDDAEALAPRVEARLSAVFGAPRAGLLAPTGRIDRLGAVVEPIAPNEVPHLDTAALRALAPGRPDLAADALALDLLARSLGR
jgi:hypothetical protein